MVSQLADLLRASFSETQKHETALRDEMELLRSYLGIQKTRFGEALQVRLHVEAAARDALVPSLCLQPLVENAIVHGVSKRAEPGTVTVRAHRDRADLLIEVSDDGVGAPDGEITVEGVGLGNTRDRLEQLYGTAAGIEIEAPVSGGFVVRLRIPYHERPVDTPEG
jgi:sensor histidine kinase YesM